MYAVLMNVNDETSEVFASDVFTTENMFDSKYISIQVNGSLPSGDPLTQIIIAAGAGLLFSPAQIVTKADWIYDMGSRRLDN